MERAVAAIPGPAPGQAGTAGAIASSPGRNGAFMMLKAGKTLRFKGRHAEADADEFESLLHGRCRRAGNELLVTRDTRLGVMPSPELADIQRIELQPGVLGDNGHAEATPIRIFPQQ